MRDDVRWAIRYARRRPILALTVTVTLAAAIGAAATAFGLATAVLWRPLPFRDASRLVFVWEEAERDGQRYPSRVTGARHAAWRDETGGLASLSLFAAAGFTIESPAGATSVRGVRVSANYFDTLGIRPLLGRTFAPNEEQPGNHRVVILSYPMWQERFGGRRDVVGETVRLSGQPFTVIGVMPRDTFPAWPVNPAIVTLTSDSRQLWVPIPHTADLDRSARAHVYGVLARLAPGVSGQQAMDQLNRTSDPSAPDPHRARVEPLRDQFVHGARAQFLALTGAAMAVLLIACTNVAALFVSAFESRRAEFAVRAAIGASVARMVRQLAIEASLLAIGGAIGGLVIARTALTAIPGLLPPSVPFLTRPTVDFSVVAFAVVVAAIASTILTAWPIVRLIADAPSPRGSIAPPRGLVYRSLVVSQVAVTVALVAAAALLGQSLRTIRQQDTGFAVEDVFVADVELPAAPSPDPAAIAIAERELLAAVAAKPGVVAVADAYDHPLEANWSETLTIVGDVTAEPQRQQVEVRIVSPGYFEALDVELLDGRTLTERDTLDAPGAVVVNEAFARALGGRVLGRRVRSSPPRFTYGNVAPAEFEIVGIVHDERFRGLEMPAQPAYYLSTRQFPQTSFSLLVRTARDPLAVAADVRSAVRAANAAAAVSNATSLARILSDQLAQRRVTTEVIGGFATAALALAALGMYGLLAMLVSSRTREIGVRLAIGASPSSLAQQVVADALRSATAGIAVGCLLALAAGSLLQSLLVGVSGRDPRTLLTVAGVLLAVAIVAAAIPARRAAHVNPLAALRAE
jgi:putative ABC transport system permease protein